MIVHSSLLAQALRTQRVETQIELARWSSGNALLAGLVLTLAALYLVRWMYRRESRGRLSSGLRWTLIGCRVAVLLLLGLIGLEPVLVNYVHRKLDATTVVLVDDSASMGLKDAYRDPTDAVRVRTALGAPMEEAATRTELEMRLLGDANRGLLSALARENPVKVLTFGDAVRPAAFVEARRRRPGDIGRPRAAGLHRSAGEEESSSADGMVRLSADGSGTDVSAALRAALEAAGGAPLAGVVVLSDGGFNQGEPPEVVAGVLKQKGVALHVVGIGDPSPPVNVAVIGLDAPRAAFKNDPFSVTVRLEASNVGPEPIVVTLYRRSGPGAPAVPVDRTSVNVDDQGRVSPVVFERKETQPGVMSYVARVEPAADESILTDNERESHPPLTILDDKMRVLIVAGAPSYDYRFLSRLLERDATVDLSTWLQSADVNAVRDGNTIITELPDEPEELFEYDAIVLMDCDPAEFDPTWGSLLSTFVTDHGGGVLYAAGHKYTTEFFRSPATASLVEILPVAPDPDAELILNELGLYQKRPWPVVIPDDAIGNPILRLDENPAANRATWSALGGVYWHYPVRREKALAQVLMRHSNPRMVNAYGPHVLLATQYAGSGRSGFLAFNSTWRWRRHDETRFNQFWIQLLRSLVEGRFSGGRSRGQIFTDRDQFDIGESVSVTVRALDERFNPLALPELEMVVTPIAANAAPPDVARPPSAGQQPPEPMRIRLTPVPGREGHYRGEFLATVAGTMHLSVTLPALTAGSAAAPERIETDLRIRPSDLEMKHTALDRPALRRLAEAAGGRYYDVDAVSQIAGAIPDASQTLITRERPRPLWDNGYVLGLLVAVLTLEWILRKKAKLL